MNKFDDLILNVEIIDEFCEHLAGQKRQPDTQKRYRTYLAEILEYLPEDKKLTKEALSDWKEQLTEEYSSTSTINVRISVVNRFLNFAGRRDLQIERVKHKKSVASRDLSRNEYLRLLQAAKLRNKERLYLMIKVFATMGLSVGDIKNFTVETLGSGYMSGTDKERGCELFIPAPLRKELNSYVRRMGVSSGPVFCTRNGNPIDRANISFEMRSLSREARVAPEKCNPRSLAKMYATTREEIDNEMAILAERTYIRILESEQTVYGWES